MDDAVRPLASDPLAELPVKNSRYIKECTEIYLGHRGITYLTGFERFVNLESLWINNNNITYIECLSANFRIRELYAQCNNITDLPNSCIGVFKFLFELQLFDNQIADLDSTLEVLCKFRHLEQLGLFGNPVAEEPNYRIKVISQMPSLRVLDNRKVTDEERVLGRKMIRDAKRKERAIANGRQNNAHELMSDSFTVSAKTKGQQQPQASGGNENTPRRLLTPEELVRDRSSCVQLLRTQVFAIQRAEEQQRHDKEQARVTSLHQKRQAQRDAPIPLPNFLDFATRRSSVRATATRSPPQPQIMDEWQIYRLACLIDNAVHSSSESKANDAELSRKHVRGALDEMERQAGWRLTNATSIFDSLFPLVDNDSLSQTKSPNDGNEYVPLVSRDEAMRALTGRSRIALANDMSSFDSSHTRSGSTKSSNDRSTPAHQGRKATVMPIWEMCSVQDCRGVARSAQTQLDQLSAKLSLLQGRSTSQEVGSGKEGQEAVELYRAIMEKAALASRLLSLVKARDTNAGSETSLLGGKSNQRSRNRRRNQMRCDSMRLVSYPEPPASALKQNIDDVALDRDPETRDKLMTVYGLKGARYENFMSNKRAQVYVPAVWKTFNI